MAPRLRRRGTVHGLRLPVLPAVHFRCSNGRRIAWIVGMNSETRLSSRNKRERTRALVAENEPLRLSLWVPVPRPAWDVEATRHRVPWRRDSQRVCVDDAHDVCALLI